MGLTSLTGTLFRASSTPVSKLKMWTSNAPSNQINNLKTIQNYGWNWLTLTICDIQYPGNDSSCGEQSIGAGTVKGTRYISAHSHFTTYTGCLSAFVNICSIESTHTHTHMQGNLFLIDHLVKLLHLIIFELLYVKTLNKSTNLCMGYHSWL